MVFVHPKRPRRFLLVTLTACVVIPGLLLAPFLFFRADAHEATADSSYFEAEFGQLSAPFQSEIGNVFQTITTMDPAAGGRAAYSFEVATPGEYTITAVLSAPDGDSNSLFVNIDAEPDGSMIWDIDPTPGMSERTASWRGDGTAKANQFSPKYFSLGAGTHTLVIRGREQNVRLDRIRLDLVGTPPPAPTDVPPPPPSDAPPPPPKNEEPTATPVPPTPIPPTAVPPTSVPPTPVPPTAVPSAPTTPPTGEVPVAGQPCPQSVHDQITTTGPDGKQYPTWHPPVDPQSGCLFGHEHGADPRTSAADNTMPAFGYVGALMGVDEPHPGFKVFIMPAGYQEAGKTSPADIRMVFHMGTSGVKRYTERFHSMEYDYVARDGSGRSAHVYGMADTGTELGSTCSNPRKGGRDFSTLGCDDPYEIWSFKFQIMHPDDPYKGMLETRLAIGGAVAVFDPVTTRDPSDNNRLLYSQDVYRPGSGIPGTSPQATFQGCQREFYGGPVYSRNAGRPTVYYTDPMGQVYPGPGPGLIMQEVSATTSDNNLIVKLRQDHCGNGIHAPN